MGRFPVRTDELGTSTRTGGAAGPVPRNRGRAIGRHAATSLGLLETGTATPWVSVDFDQWQLAERPAGEIARRAVEEGARVMFAKKAA